MKFLEFLMVSFVSYWRKKKTFNEVEVKKKDGLKNCLRLCYDRETEVNDGRTLRVTSQSFPCLRISSKTG